MNTPPPLFKAVTSSDFAPNGIPERVFITCQDAMDWLQAILEDWHEGIAFESDGHHRALDTRFWAVSRVVIV